jgi:hypothetical protein
MAIIVIPPTWGGINHYNRGCDDDNNYGREGLAIRLHLRHHHNGKKYLGGKTTLPFSLSHNDIKKCLFLLSPLQR